MSLGKSLSAVKFVLKQHVGVIHPYLHATSHSIPRVSPEDAQPHIQCPSQGFSFMDWFPPSSPHASCHSSPAAPCLAGRLWGWNMTSTSPSQCCFPFLLASGICGHPRWTFPWLFSHVISGKPILPPGFVCQLCLVQKLPHPWDTASAARRRNKLTCSVPREQEWQRHSLLLAAPYSPWPLRRKLS